MKVHIPGVNSAASAHSGLWPIADAACVHAPRLARTASDFIAPYLPNLAATLSGDTA
jgi:hypothetical protein